MPEGKMLIDGSISSDRKHPHTPSSKPLREEAEVDPTVESI
jgi:hypothetical protein